MVLYITLENIPKERLYESFLQAFVGFPIALEATFEGFCKMLLENEYCPSISLGAVEETRHELVGFVLNSLRADECHRCAYAILTGTKPVYRRQGIGGGLFQKVIPLLKQKGADQYKTEVLKSNEAAIALYKAQGFTISGEVTSVLESAGTSRTIHQYELIKEL